MPIDKPLTEEATRILNEGLPRHEAFDAIPHGSSRILDIGYGDGRLLLRLMHEKDCTDCYGLEILKREALTEYLEENWNVDLFEEDLPEKYFGYFNYIILHDVLEHIYNPWKFLGIVNKYLAQGGKAIIICPNAQYWEVPYALLTGNWPLGKHGFWNEDHIRWFTFKSLCEVAIMAGFSVNEAYLQYPQRTNQHMEQLQAAMGLHDNRVTEFPLLDFPAGHVDDGFPFRSPTINGADTMKIMGQHTTPQMLPYLLAIKNMLVCEKRAEPYMFDIKPMMFDGIRKAFYDSLDPVELQARIPQSIEVQVARG